MGAILSKLRTTSPSVKLDDPVGDSMMTPPFLDENISERKSHTASQEIETDKNAQTSNQSGRLEDYNLLLQAQVEEL